MKQKAIFLDTQQSLVASVARHAGIKLLEVGLEEGFLAGDVMSELDNMFKSIL